MAQIRNRSYLFISFLLIALSLFLRYLLIDNKNGDILLIRTWYEFLAQNGYKGLANGEFSNYTPAYLYLVYFATLLKDWIAPFTALKLIPTAFDVISAVTVYKIARTKYQDDTPYLYASIFFLLPTVMLNSTSWGQIDSLYGSFLLVCFYFLLTNRPLLAMTAFGIAFSFKAQSIFILPFLGIMLLRKKISWYHFFIVPVVYLILALPAAWLGRSWESILLIYIGQAGQFEQLTRYAPNLYFFFSEQPLHPGFEIGMSIFFVIMSIWAWINWKTKPPVTINQLVLTALTSAALVPFLLPKMLDRYFYPADLFSFISVIFIPELWILALLFQVSSGLVYMIFPFGMPAWLVIPAGAINTALVIIALRRQILSLKEK